MISEVKNLDWPFETITKEIKNQPDKFCETVRDYPDRLFYDREWK